MPWASPKFHDLLGAAGAWSCPRSCQQPQPRGHQHCCPEGDMVSARVQWLGSHKGSGKGVGAVPWACPPQDWPPLAGVQGWWPSRLQSHRPGPACRGLVFTTRREWNEAPFFFSSGCALVTERPTPKMACHLFCLHVPEQWHGWGPLRVGGGGQPGFKPQICLPFTPRGTSQSGCNDRSADARSAPRLE